ncbi:ubiquitin-like-specific protease ESD4 isoform X5 [Rhododendron vialii]|uniref:ubiquitin-like-specific protease ESD4 isoform X5 n=1 Tax=Rhododendron vialii TaxID=182163 RepID=UPI00265E091B|nr:ubiquitin-like-specific protease ESD4 isoform X5 [Rhododendron vialii]
MEMEMEMEVQIQTHRETAKMSCEEMTGSTDKPSDLSAEVCEHHIVKHPACQPHITGCPQANQKIKTIEEIQDRKNQTLIPLDLLGGFPRRSRSKRIVNHGSISAPENAVVDFHEDLTAKSSASQPPFPKRRCAYQKKKRRQKDEETSDPEVVNRSSGRERSKRRVNCDNGIVPQQGKLDSSAFECYLENLWTSFSEEKRSSFTHLDCLWFSLYTKESYKAKVLDWIKKKQIFSKKYVFIPIVRWSHWSLLIFCNFGESLQTKSRTPCMLLLDSLQIANPRRLEPEIRKFVLDIYRAEERPEIPKQISRIPLKIPKVPQQRNAEECGNFVLYYINLFIESAPENFSISEGYPYFMKKNWFTPEGLEDFCKRFNSTCP